MTPNISLSDTDALAQFMCLKRNARNVRDIAHWMMQHPELFDQTRRGTVTDVVIGVRAKSSREFVQLSNNSDNYELSMFHEQDPENDLVLHVEVHRSRDNYVPDIFNALSSDVHPVNNGSPVDRRDIPIALSDWSFLVAGCTGRYIRNEMWDSANAANPTLAEKVRVFLNNHLPRHFPGVSLESLQTLHSSGLITDFLADEIKDLIFDNRVGEAKTENLPTDFAPYLRS